MASPYKKQVRVYEYQFEPNFSPDSTAQWLEQQFLGLQRASRQSAEAIQELQNGTATGSTVALPAISTLTAGTYENPILTVSKDGRVVAIREAPEAAPPIPRPEATGLVLTSSPSGAAVWARLPSPYPESGTAGQVLTRTGTGAVWSDIPAPPPAPTGPSLLGVSGVVLTRDTNTIRIGLTKTGVRAGSYARPLIAVGEDGRITFAVEQPPEVPTPIAYSADATLGSFRYWRVLADGSTNTPPLDSTVAFINDGVVLTGTLMPKVDGEVSIDLGTESRVDTVRVTTAAGSAGLITGRVVASLDGRTWGAVMEIPRQEPWDDGETREYSLSPQVGTGGGTATGIDPNYIFPYTLYEDEVTGDILKVSFANGAMKIEAQNTFTAEDGSILLAQDGSYLTY